ncbi:YfiT family bacillithiol transferase [Paenibacillus paeoniae]|uniref:Putative metal-dependent hydrolase n=1 Tax=Paenibacillus paeoniae TaxID=2292705 RepID=A0A371PMX3_9BACL|nr:putative metal-dependent hydrolase [Paenibacillus paeoniae]REK77019.1 putative metal-dependent hydrolase [Paenibacillus paeoniae]
MDAIRFPIGTFLSQDLSPNDRIQLIAELPTIAQSLRQVANSITEAQLESSYRPDGWTIRQIIHHMADNDMNAYIRFKRALTEEAPAASSYREDLWAELADYKSVPVAHAIGLLELVHERLIIVMSRMKESDFERTLTTQALGSVTLGTALKRLVWHNRHHLAQIKSAIH